MLVKIYPENPNPKEISRVVEILRNDGLIIYPTDGVYAFGCSLSSGKAIERLKAIRNKKNDELTIVCDGLSHISEYAKVDNIQFRILKRNLPGAFTFILQASGKIPSKALGRRKTVGVRVPDNSIAIEIVRALEMPMVTASVKDIDQMVEYTTDPELIEERYNKVVELVIDGGYGSFIPSTIVDITTDEPEIIREGVAELL